MSIRSWLLLALAILGNCCASRAAERVDFAAQIAPIFHSHCFSCHGPDKQESEFRLDLGEKALSGGLYGKAIVPGQSQASPLITYVSDPDADLVMPPEGPRLSEQEIALLRKWIDEGAVWPAGDDMATVAANEKDDPRRWAFQPLAAVAVPTVEQTAWVRNPIDAFILARQAAAELTPSAAADRVTLIRRLNFDLLGLPPSPERVAEFIADTRPNAYELLVEELLASPHYGERWGRHWLDVVRFAESNGFETNTARPNAWHYRDYVIQSFNEDKPYQQFIREQLAGDAVGADVATGFLVAGPFDQVKSPDPVLTKEQRMNELHDMVSTTGSVFLGLTVGCARCHNHKFDPISQKDYYALQAVFAGVQHGERALKSADDAERVSRLATLDGQLNEVDAELVDYEPLAALENTTPPRRVPVHPQLNSDRFAPVAARFIRFTVQATNLYEPCLDELEVFAAGANPVNVALASNGAKASSSSNYPGAAIHQLAHVHDGKYGNSQSWISHEVGGGWVQLEFPDIQTIDRVVWGRDRELKYLDRLATQYTIEVATEPGKWQTVASAADRRPFVPDQPRVPSHTAEGETPQRSAKLGDLLARRDALQAERTRLATPVMAYCGQFNQPPATHRLHRGDAMQPREVVGADAIASLGEGLSLPPEASDQQRRLALANWLSRTDNPLVTRVLVNRLWHYHFGQGLVNTPSDFGGNGARPSHPELLDWLAQEFLASGGRMKSLHRLMVTSNTYQQASTPAADGLKIDADCRLLWRFPPRRLEAEPIRDAILAVAGTLDLKQGGPGYDAFESNNNYVKVYKPKETFGPAEWRRMIYESKPRMELDITFGAFDCPDAGQVTPKRNSSTTPLQALNLLNSTFVVEQAEQFAARLARDAGPETAHQVERAFQLAFQRSPSERELAAATGLIQEHGLAVFCRALFNANEFLHLN